MTMNELALRMDQGFEMILKVLQEHTDEVLDVDGLCKMTGLSRSAVYQKTCSLNGRPPELPHFRRGKRLYFRRAEINKWLTTNRKSTADELQAAAANLPLTKKKPFRRAGWNVAHQQNV